MIAMAKFDRERQISFKGTARSRSALGRLVLTLQERRMVTLPEGEDITRAGVMNALIMWAETRPIEEIERIIATHMGAAMVRVETSPTETPTPPPGPADRKRARGKGA